TEVFAVVDGADAGGDAELDIWHLAIAALAANLPDGFEHVQHAAGGRRLAAVDHAAAGLDRQIAFERKIGFFEERLVVSPAKAQVFDLNHHDRNIIVVEIQTADVLVRDTRHVESAFAGLRDAGD